MDYLETPHPIKPEIMVAGLTMLMPLDTQTSGIGGPAVYAAVGVHHAPVQTKLLTAVGSDLSLGDAEMVQRLDGNTQPLRVEVNRPMIRWSSAEILGERAQGKLSDDPSRWRAMPPRDYLFAGQALLLANGDPQWYADLLERLNPPLIFMDIHMAWLQVREKALKKCMLRSHILTMTEFEYKALPNSVRSSTICLSEKRLLIIKRGMRGVSIISPNTRVDLPAPKPAALGTDVGCGDFLIGLLAGGFLTRVIAEPRMPWTDILTETYLDSLDSLRQLIESKYSASFVHRRFAELINIY